MTMEPAQPHGVTDPFGDSVAERLWRRLAGAGTAVLITAAGFLLWRIEVLPLVLIGITVVYLLGLPASWLLCRRPGTLISRHLLAGLVVAALTTTLLVLGAQASELWPAFAVITIGIGMPLSAAAAWAGTALPHRWVKPLALTGLLFAATIPLSATVAAVGWLAP